MNPSKLSSVAFLLVWSAAVQPCELDLAQVDSNYLVGVKAEDDHYQEHYAGGGVAFYYNIRRACS